LTDDAKMHQAGAVNERFDDYLKHLTDGASYRAIAERAQIEPSKLTRQLKGELKVQTVVAVARAYGGSLLRAFVAAGFITEDEATSMAALSGIEKATDRELAEEILRRVRANEGEHPVLTEPIGASFDVSGPDEDLTELHEDAVKSRWATAANTDKSAERLDQETL
jgi:hypothetical protein